ncbi:MAG: N-6 DNA methylase [bacterium]
MSMLSKFDLFRRTIGNVEDNELANILLASVHYNIKGDLKNEVSEEVIKRLSVVDNITKSKINNYLDECTTNDLDDVIQVYCNLKSKSRDIDFNLDNDTIKKLIVNLLEIEENETVVDLGSGEGFIFKTIYDELKHKKFEALGIEINSKTCENSKIFLDLLNIKNTIIDVDYQYLINCTYDKGYTFPPLGVKKNSILDDMHDEGRFKKTTSYEWFFVDYLIYHMKDNSKFIALLPDGCLFRHTDDTYRKYLIENNLIEGIISLPSQISTYTGIKLSLVIFSKNNNEIKLIDATNYKLEDSKKVSNINYKEITKLYKSKKVFTVSYDDLGSEDVLTVNRFLVNDIEVKCSQKLEDLVEIRQGSQYTMANFNNSIVEVDTKYKILTSNDINKGQVRWDYLINIEPDEKLLKHKLQKNDIVMTAKSSTVKIVIFEEKMENNIIVTGGMFIIRPCIDKINPLFLKMFLESNKGQEILKRIQKGSIIPVIRKNDLMSIEVSCPNIDIQDKLTLDYKDKIMLHNELINKLEILKNQISSYYESIEDEL